MSDKDDKTEEATPRKRLKLREEGNVAKSQDIGAAGVLLAAVVAAAAFGQSASLSVMRMTQRCFRLEDDALEALEQILPVLRDTVAPVIVSAFLAAVVMGVVQTRGLFSWKALELKPERLNPGPNLKNVLPSKTTLIELGKSFLKLGILGVVVYRVVANATPDFGYLAAAEPWVAAGAVMEVAKDLIIQGGLTFVAMAALDYYIALRRFNEDAKMSKDEVKDEHKDQEGRPEVKMKRRQRAREMAKARVRADVKDATVLVCNPTHVAIALRYDDETPAPVVLAKGVDEVALAMKAVAREHRVPIIENRPLARSLLKTAKLGVPIPVETYEAVAQVIAQVLRLRAG